MEEFKIGIVIADKDEYLPLLRLIEGLECKEYSVLGRMGHTVTLKNNIKVIAINCGIGKVNAAAVTMHLVDKGCNIILNYGLSGGISGVKKGEITVPDKFLEHDFDLTTIGYKLCEKPDQEYIYSSDIKLLDAFREFYPQAKVGTAVTGDCFICDEKVRNSLKDAFNAMSCDMETAAIAYVCKVSNIPFLSLRKISDDAGDNAAESYRQINNKKEIALPNLILEFINNLV